MRGTVRQGIALATSLLLRVFISRENTRAAEKLQALHFTRSSFKSGAAGEANCAT